MTFSAFSSIPGRIYRSPLFGTMPRRVVLMATIASSIVLGVTALIMIYFYSIYEMRAFDARLVQDKQITAQDFVVDQNGLITRYETGSETLYNTEGSGWFWQLFQIRPDGLSLIDQSPSLGPMTKEAFGLDFPRLTFGEFTGPDGAVFRGALTEVNLFGDTENFMMGIAGPVEHVDAKVGAAVTLILSIFFCVALLYTLIVYYVVRSGLDPLKRLQTELEVMQAGQGAISLHDWPADLEPIVEELRVLDGRIGSLIDRHRRQASDLAHSLKTPLAIISRITPDLPDAARGKIEEQTERITTAVRRNLSRLRTGAITAESTQVHEAVEEIVYALEILFREKALDIRNEISKSEIFRGDPDDLKEIVGNLLDNACKWARSKVTISCVRHNDEIYLSFEDDGPGLAGSRGQNGSSDKKDVGEELVSGVGLLIVEDIAAMYDGGVERGASDMGGAKIVVRLPAGAAPM